MKRWVNDAGAFLVIVYATGAFFLPLLWPTPKLIVTPDFGRSDAWHLSFAGKQILSEHLKRNTLPVWTSLLGGGFPITAEGSIGTLYLPNLILFRLLDVVTAYNLSLALSVILMGWGMYVWLRVLGMPRLVCLYLGLTAGFSGIMATHLTHIMIVQSLALMPWVMAMTHALIVNPTARKTGICAFIVSQQILAGFPQTVFITLLFSAGYACYLTLTRRRITSITLTIRAITLYLASVVLGIIASAIQLLPAGEFLSQTGVARGFRPEVASYFSFPLDHLVTLFNPFMLGNPRNGTFEIFTDRGSVFWENTGYVGFMPLIFLTGLFIKRKNTRDSQIGFFLLSLVASFLLMWGRHSPVYLVYSLWPFTLFRVPSRFIWPFVISLIVVSGYGLTAIMKRVRRYSPVWLVVLALLTTQILELAVTWRGYHAIQEASGWVSSPPMASSVVSPGGRILSVASDITHNRHFLSRGWTDLKPFARLRNVLDPNSNAIWAVPSLGVYTGRPLRRIAYYNDFLFEHVQITDTAATASATFKKLLDMGSVETVLSSIPLHDNGLLERGSVSYDDGLTITAYTNPNALPRVYLASRAIYATTVEQAKRIVEAPDFDYRSAVITEQAVNLNQTHHPGNVTITEETDTVLRVSITGTKGRAMLVVTDTYYPGWKATVDGAPAAIVPVNIRFRGVLIPAGDHEVTMRYEPESYARGVKISAAMYTLIIILMAFPLVSRLVRTRQKVPALASGRPRSHGKLQLRSA